MQAWILVQLKNHRLRTFFFLTWILYFVILWSDMLAERSDGLYAGHPYVWADWSLHIGLASVIAYKPIALWFSDYPIYAGAKLTYPFMTNLLSGILMRFGVSLPSSFVLPSLICSIVTLFFLYRFFRLLLKKDSMTLASMTVFLFSGGIGAFLLARTQGLRTVLFDSTVVTTQIPELGIETNNILSSMMIPQRAFLLGLPIGLAIMTLLVRVFCIEKTKQVTTSLRAWLVLAGFLAGVLPITHTHTFIVIVLFSLYLFGFSYRRVQTWMWYAVPAIITTLLVFWTFLIGNVNTSSFVSIHPGWLTGNFGVSWLLFWWENWGFFGILAVFGTVMMGQEKEHLLTRITFFFWGIFVLANLFQFQPQLWDNTKLFAWVYMGLSISAVYGLQQVWRNNTLLTRILVLTLFGLSIFSGGIDVLHNLDSEAKTFRMLSNEQIAMGKWVREHTLPESVILTSEMVANPISMLSGRSTLVGYSGWMFNFGLPYAQRIRDIEAIYKDPQGNQEKLVEYRITHILVSLDEQELEVSPSIPFEKVYANAYGTLYDTSKLLPPTR